MNILMQFSKIQMFNKIYIYIEIYFPNQQLILIIISLMTSKKIIQNAVRYPPSLFHSKNIEQAFFIAGKTKFANIFLPNQPDMDILFAPFFHHFHKNQNKVLYAHLVRSNPLYLYLQQKKEAQCRLVFNQADMYISPTVYEQKNISHKVVPTWNYVSVQFKGILSLVPDTNLRQLLEDEVQIFESDASSKWRLSDAPNDYVQGLMKSIFGIKVEVSQWKVHKKLSQNKSQKQFNNTKNWCSQQSKKQMSIADWMNHYQQKKN